MTLTSTRRASLLSPEPSVTVGFCMSGDRRQRLQALIASRTFIARFAISSFCCRLPVESKLEMTTSPRAWPWPLRPLRQRPPCLRTRCRSCRLEVELLDDDQRHHRAVAAGAEMTGCADGAATLVIPHVPSSGTIISATMLMILISGLDCGTCGVLVRIAHRVAGHRRLVRVGPLPP
jgi:hypothetical protein